MPNAFPSVVARPQGEIIKTAAGIPQLSEPPRGEVGGLDERSRQGGREQGIIGIARKDAGMLENPGRGSEALVGVKER